MIFDLEHEYQLYCNWVGTSSDNEELRKAFFGGISALLDFIAEGHDDMNITFTRTTKEINDYFER